MTDAAPRLRNSTIFLHGSVGLPTAMFGYPIAIWLPAFYAGELGVSLAVVGTMIMLARLSDVVTDPIIGFFSDRSKSSYGRRKPFMIAGLPILVIGVLMLFVPKQLGFEEVGRLHLLLWISFMFLGSTLVYIPYYAWGAELSPDYNERSRITAVREVFILVGLAVAAAIPFAVELIDGAGAGRDPGRVLMVMAWAILILMPSLVLLVAWRVAEPKAETRKEVPLLEGLRLVSKNGPMVRVLAIILIVTGGEAFRNALSLFFMRDVIGINSIGSLYFIYFGAGLAAIPFWLWLGRKMSKHKAFAVCMAAVAAISVATYFLGPGDVVPFTVLFTAKGFCFGGLQFLPLSMLADVVDVDTARSKGKRAGTFFAISGMTAKLATAFGTGISLNVVAFFGFNPSGAAGVNGPAEMNWLAVNYAIMPAVFFLGALWLTWNYPLSAERQARLRGFIERRTARLEAENAALSRIGDAD
ncbi:MAG: MFS transporter [Parvibaculaceae bacterium]